MRKKKEKKKGTAKCDKRTVTYDVGTAQCEDETVKCERKKRTPKCDKSTVKCYVGIVKCDNGIIKREEKNKGTTKCDKRTVTCDVGTAEQLHMMLKLHNMRMKPSNARKINEPPNVTKE